MLIENSKVKKF